MSKYLDEMNATQEEKDEDFFFILRVIEREYGIGKATELLIEAAQANLKEDVAKSIDSYKNSDLSWYFDPFDHTNEQE